MQQIQHIATRQRESARRRRKWIGGAIVAVFSLAVVSSIAENFGREPLIMIAAMMACCLVACWGAR
jgi:hypothetical protein